MGRVDCAGGIDRAIAFLRQTQRADGSFESSSSPTHVPFQPEVTYRTVFAPAIILGALGDVQTKDANTIRQQLASWLLSQKSEQWSFNYWAKDAPEFANTPYPDDLDDTFCALIGLHRHNPNLLDEACLAKVVRLLLATEQQVGGPYRTWLATPDSAPVWRDVDIAVNSNIACFLGLVAQPLPNITILMEQAIGGTLRSPYYPSEYPLLYYLARAYRGPQQTVLANRIWKQQIRGAWQTPLQTALAVSALLQLGVRPAKLQSAIAYLLRKQQADGAWPVEAFWMDATFHGSPALTTALVIEALVRYQTQESEHMPPASPGSSVSPVYREIMQAAQHRLSQLNPALRSSARTILQRIDQSSSRQEVVLLPFLFARPTQGQPPVAEHNRYVNLSLANLYGWMAYTVYDDFLDDEGEPLLLSAANFSLRQSLEHFRQALPDNPNFQQRVAATFDIIDNANTWEVQNCRFKVTNGQVILTAIPHYPSTLAVADRSLGHALTPLGVLAAEGTALDSSQAKALLTALRHYLVARQLHDDAHDWEDDLRAGRCSYVVADLLRAENIPTGTHEVNELVSKLQVQFWHHRLPELCKTMRRHLRSASDALQRSRLGDRGGAFRQLLQSLENAVVETQAEQSGAEKFLEAYRQ